ncbi:MAG: flagellar biosynthetic protein FliO [Acidaminococcales bacterium]|nr:flagellar biosynthetic protein FliO [Acidaminococcales bacterium]
MFRFAPAFLPPSAAALGDKLAGAAAGSPGYLENRGSALTGNTAPYSTFFYILTLIFAFFLVLLLAYLASKLIGGKFGAARMRAAGNVLGSMPLDHNKRIVFVELNGAVLVLGVTEHSVSLLKEISSSVDIERIKEDLSGKNQEGVFGYQSRALDNLQKKIKPMLRNLPGGKKRGPF